MLNQLLREIQLRLWSDLPYRYRGHGSDVDLMSVDEVRLGAAFAKMLSPSEWTLVLAGNINDTNLVESLTQTVGTIQALSQDNGESVESGSSPRLGTRLQLPASLSQKHAVIAYRLKPASETRVEALMLLSETIRRSPQAQLLEEDLMTDGVGSAEITVGAEFRRQAGIFYLAAGWTGSMDSKEVLDRLEFLATGITGTGQSAEALKAARKSLLIQYWQRRQTVDSYTTWTGLRIAAGIKEDNFVDNLTSLKPEDLKQAAETLLTKDNRISLVTIPK